MNDLRAWLQIIPKVEKTGDFKPLLEALRTGKPTIVPYAAHWLANLLDPDLPLAGRNKYHAKIGRAHPGKPKKPDQDRQIYEFCVKLEGPDGKIPEPLWDEVKAHFKGLNIGKAALRKSYERGRDSHTLFSFED